MRVWYGFNGRTLASGTVYKWTIKTYVIFHFPTKKCFAFLNDWDLPQCEICSVLNYPELHSDHETDIHKVMLNEHSLGSYTQIRRLQKSRWYNKPTNNAEIFVRGSVRP